MTKQLAFVLPLLVAVSGSAMAATPATRSPDISAMHTSRFASDDFAALNWTAHFPAAAPDAHAYHGGPKSDD